MIFQNYFEGVIWSVLESSEGDIDRFKGSGIIYSTPNRWGGDIDYVFHIKFIIQ